jgi:3-oxoacyl-[acyl-carrier-protein] synthase-3
MLPFLADPFRGARERRVLSCGGTALSLEVPAAAAVLEAADMAPDDIDLMLVSSYLPDQIGPGNAAMLARELGLSAPAWNIESTCSGTLVALQTAAAMATSGYYRNILIVISTTFSRTATETADALAWFSGDGAAALIVGPARDGAGMLGFKTINTTMMCDTFYHELYTNAGGVPGIRMKARAGTARVLAKASGPVLQQCCEEAVKAAGADLGAIDFFVFHTWTMWYAEFCARWLGVDKSKTINTFPMYGNVGQTLTPVNLYHAAASGRIRKDELVSCAGNSLKI